MPTYDYKCPSCHKVQEKSHKMNEIISFNCLECMLIGSPSSMIKCIGGGLSLHFKGSGFYETDYKNK